MSLLATDYESPNDRLQSRLLQLAALFLLLYAIILTLAPAVRLHSWQVAYHWNQWIGYVVWLVGVILVHRQLIYWLPDRDPFLFPIGALLAGWGLMTIWRLDSLLGARQTVWIAVSLAVFAAGLRIKDLLSFLRRYKYLWLTCGLILTGLTFLFGTYPGGYGPHLWLGCCGVYLMPSEPLKLLLIVYLSAYLADRLPVSFSLAQLLAPTLVLIGAALILLVGQRDLGTASLFILIYTVVVYIASNRKRTLIISALVLIAAAVTGYLLFDVVRVRVDAWINPWIDPAGRSYQIVQSIIAVASGDFLGMGPGLGSPGVVPVAHSDFIFAAITEETGMLGGIGMLLLYAMLVARGFRAAIYATNNYQRYLSAGITVYLVAQAIFIIGGNLRLLPLTGVTLPFVSYGGSSLLTAFISLLILTLITGPGDEDPAPLPNPFPYLLVSGVLLLGLLALTLGIGWWSDVRAAALLSRPENPRPVITDRYVKRGALLDRNNQPINSTTGQPGSYQRQYDYPPLSDTTGYNSALYGQAGLEASLNGYLRGLQGNPESLVLWDNLLYDQPPPGLDVRLTIDLGIQKQADALMQAHKGALVLLNANTGEILAIASHPYFNPSKIDTSWNSLIQDPNAPLLNRATQGSYPPGASLGPFLLDYANSTNAVPPVPTTLSYTGPQGTYNCALEPGLPVPIEKAVADGCPGALAALGKQIGAEGMQKLFASLGFYSMPNLPLPSAGPSPEQINQPELAAIGQAELNVTPLQMALAAAALSNNGARPAPSLASAILNPQTGWQPFQHPPATNTLLGDKTSKTLSELAMTSTPYWQTIALANASGKSQLTWYLAGTLPQWQGTSLALALVLEEPNPKVAEHIGQTLMNSILK